VLVVSVSLRLLCCTSRSAALAFNVDIEADEEFEEYAMPTLAVSSASDSWRSISRVRRPGRESMSRRGSTSSVEDWIRVRNCR